MPVELILMEDIQDLGRIGDQVRVADGYARNYLLPKGYAVAVTPGNLRRLEARKLALQKEYEDRIAVAQTVAEKVAAASVTITAEAKEDESLYGSIGAEQIVANLKEQGLEIDRHSIILPENIHQLGVFEVAVKLHEEVQATLKVWVVRK